MDLKDVGPTVQSHGESGKEVMERAAGWNGWRKE